MRSIATNIFKASKEKWVKKLLKELGEEYFLVNSRTLMGTNLTIFA